MGLNPIGNPDWPKETADTIERLVGMLRDRTTKPAVTIVRGLVFGLLGAFIGLIALTAGIIMVLRVLQLLWAVPFDHDTSVWLSYFTVGGIFCLASVFLMMRRHSGEPQH